MEHTSIDATGRRAGGHTALTALLVVQVALGYEWLSSGLTKLVRGDFPRGLGAELAESPEGIAGWYRGFLEAAILPHATAVGYAIEIAELATGVVLIVTAVAWLVVWERLPRGVRLAALVAMAGAAFAGAVMNVAFHLAHGSPFPHPVAMDSFEEAVDLDSLMAVLELVLVAVSVGALLSLARGDATPSHNNIGRGQGSPSEKETIMMQNHTYGTLRQRGRWALRLLAPLVAGLALGAAFFGAQGGGATPATAESQVATLRAAVAGARQDATFWRQLTAVLKPAPANLRTMQDHRLLMLPGGIAIGLHFDNMNLAKAKNLNWVVLGVPGTFTKTDQQRVTKQFGPGFVHFHDVVHDTHGGKPGAKGFWFVHVGARNFTSMFGKVKAGAIDSLMMPTPPQS